MKYFLRIRNVFIFILALASIVRYGRRSVPPAAPRRVLVVQLSKLGDMVCITPVLRALRTQLPEATIYVLGDALNKELLKGSPDVDHYLVFTDLWPAVGMLRREKIDIAIIRGTTFVGLASALLAGVPAIIAPRVVNGKALATRTYGRLLPYVRTVDFRMGKYMPRQFLMLLEPLGIHATDTTKHLVHSEAAETYADELFMQNRIDAKKDFVVGISPSAGNKIKEWPEERFAEVADYLVEKHRARIVLIGGPGDAAKVQNMLAHMRRPEGVVNLQGRCTIDQLKALVSKLSLFISVDTGPIYIAEAYDVPTIDIVGPMDEHEQPPQGPRHKAVVPQRKAPALHIMNARIYDEAEARRQTLGVSVQQVLRAIEELLILPDEKISNR